MRASSRFAGDTFRTKHALKCDCLAHKPDWSSVQPQVQAAVAEVLALRLRIAYLPLLQGLQRIEDRVAILTRVREDPYAPPPERQGVV